MALAAGAVLAPAALSADAGPAVERVSVTSAEEQADGVSHGANVSGDGRYVVFQSNAPNLGSDSGLTQFFVRDRAAGTTQAVGLTSQAFGRSHTHDLATSRDGRFVTFSSGDRHIVPGDTNLRYDAFVHDLVAGTTVRASVKSSEKEVKDGSSHSRGISADGRFVLFVSDARSIVKGTGGWGVFVRDLAKGKTTLVTTALRGGAADGSSEASSISGDGRFVAFWSRAGNLVANDANGETDVFVRDLKTGRTVLASVATGGAPADGESRSAYVSDDGNIVAFRSDATNMVPGDTNWEDDVFVRDMKAGTTTRISTRWDGRQAGDRSWPVGISADGRHVLLLSHADDLVPGDGNGRQDAFVYDRQAKRMMRVTADLSGVDLDSIYEGARLSADGRTVVFNSAAPGIAPDDTNRAHDVFAARVGGAPSP